MGQTDLLWSSEQLDVGDSRLDTMYMRAAFRDRPISRIFQAPICFDEVGDAQLSFFRRNLAAKIKIVDDWPASDDGHGAYYDRKRGLPVHQA